jgi:hypothetical protein
MKIIEICESTTAGSIATVAAPMTGGPLKRSPVGKGVYGKEPKGSMFKGNETTKKFVNSVNENTEHSRPASAKTKKSKNEFDAKLDSKGRFTKDSVRKMFGGKMSPDAEGIKEDELKETDLIMVPGQGHRLKSGFIPHAEDRRDHEVEMARGDLYQAHKNSSKIHKLIKNVTEDEGLEGWVQAKITKAADYLNSVRQYLEGKYVQETGGVIAGGGVDEDLNEMFGMKRRAKERMELARSENPEDRVAAVTHRSSGFSGHRHIEVCDLLVNDPDPSVRLAVANNGDYRHVLALIKDPDPGVRAAAAEQIRLFTQPNRPGPLGLG